MRHKQKLVAMAVAQALLYSPIASAVDELVMPPSTQFPVNGRALMFDRQGYSGERIRSAGGETPTPDGANGAFRISCRTTHMRFADPIVYPGQDRRSHLHVFFGHVGIDYNTNVTGNALALSGTSSCTGGTVNRSGYWTPATIDTITARPVIPTASVVYYKADVSNASSLVVPPAGLRMIAGNPSNTTEAGGVNRYRWDCLPSGGGGGTTSLSMPGASCANGSEVVLLIFFPTCWDGVNLDSSNHQSHMAYYATSSPNTCPGTHPVALPSISFNVHYKVNAQNRPENWRLSSDTYALAIPAGRSAHGDWINGWNQTHLATIINNCSKALVDCHAHLMGDGNEIY